MTDAERSETRQRWQSLWAQWRKYQDRSAWLYENQGHEQWAERDAATARSGLKVGVLRDALAEWCGVSPWDVTLLLAATSEAQDVAS